MYTSIENKLDLKKKKYNKQWTTEKLKDKWKPLIYLYI